MDAPQWSEASSSKEGYNKCSIKSHIESVNEEMKGRSIEEGDIGIRKYRRRIRVDMMNKEVKG